MIVVDDFFYIFCVSAVFQPYNGSVKYGVLNYRHFVFISNLCVCIHIYSYYQVIFKLCNIWSTNRAVCELLAMLS